MLGTCRTRCGAPRRARESARRDQQERRARRRLGPSERRWHRDGAHVPCCLTQPRTRSAPGGQRRGPADRVLVRRGVARGLLSMRQCSRHRAPQHRVRHHAQRRAAAARARRATCATRADVPRSVEQPCSDVGARANPQLRRPLRGSSPSGGYERRRTSGLSEPVRAGRVRAHLEVGEPLAQGGPRARHEPRTSAKHLRAARGSARTNFAAPSAGSGRARGSRAAQVLDELAIDCLVIRRARRAR